MKLLISFFLIAVSLNTFAANYNCRANDSSGLIVDITESNAGVQMKLSAPNQRIPQMVATGAQKIYRFLNYQFEFNENGTQANFREDKNLRNLTNNRSGLKFDCKPSTNGMNCTSAQGKMEAAFQNVPNSKTAKVTLKERMGQPNQGFVNSDITIIYRTQMGMQVVLESNGTATYSGSKKNGAIMDSNGINLSCR